MRCNALARLGLLMGLALSAAPAAAGGPAPLVRLSVPLLDGRVFDMRGEGGHVVIVHAWATWCAPCRAEMALLDRYARAHGEVVVLALSSDARRDLPMVRQMMAGMAFQGAMASAVKVNSLGEARVLPQTWVIDGGGHVVAHMGALTEAELDAAVARAR